MTHAPEPGPSTADARERLANTRLELLRHMQHERGEGPPVPPQHGQAQAAQDGMPLPPEGAEDRSEPPDDGSTWQHLRHSLRAWWHTHPAHLALEVARPVFERYAREHPLKVVGVCAATGAVLVLARPWRLISITGLIVAALKSTQMSAMAAAMLRSASKPRPPTGPDPRFHPRHSERTPP